MNNQIEFSKPGKWVMRITADRRIEVNEDVTVTEAAQTVLEAVQKLLNQPEQRKPLTWEQISQIGLECANDKSRLPFEVKLARAIEQAHGIKETP